MNTYKLQSIIFNKKQFTEQDAKHWLQTHKYKIGKVDTKTDYYRFRQISPSYINKQGYNKYYKKNVYSGKKRLACGVSAVGSVVFSSESLCIFSCLSLCLSCSLRMSSCSFSSSTLAKNAIVSTFLMSKISTRIQIRGWKRKKDYKI